MRLLHCCRGKHSAGLCQPASADECCEPLRLTRNAIQGILLALMLWKTIALTSSGDSCSDTYLML